MCGLAGFESPKAVNMRPLMRSILDEIGIRGIHSTGVSWLEGEEIKTKIENVPYYEFEIPNVETKAAIFHCRYSTSNIEFPQPVFNNNKSIVHNGVITQAPFSEWEQKYGYYGDNRCDSVLLLDSKDPIEDFPESSMAVIELTKDGIRWFRNGQRPLWEMDLGCEMYLIASTEKALSGIGTPRMVECETKKDLQTWK